MKHLFGKKEKPVTGRLLLLLLLWQLQLAVATGHTRAPVTLHVAILTA